MLLLDAVLVAWFPRDADEFVDDVLPEAGHVTV